MGVRGGGKRFLIFFLEDKNLVAPVFSAHSLTLKLPFETQPGYGNFHLPAGERPYSELYTHLPFWVQKIQQDLQLLRLWDPAFAASHVYVRVLCR